MPILAAFFFGFVPMFLLAAFVNWLDRYEKEPKLLLGAAFLWGVIVAGGGAYVLNTVFGIGIYVLTGSEGAAEFGTTSIIAPISEEGVSGMVVVRINGVAEVVRVGVAVAVQLLIVNRMRIDKMRFELTY